MEEVSLKSKGHEKAASVKGFNKKSFAFSLVLVVIYTCLLKFAFDDGLRHVGLAFADVKSGHSWMSAVAHVWGEVYPFSYFEVFKDYDPWFGYDLTLRIVATGLKSLPISWLFSQFLLTKILSIVFSLAFFYLILTRSGILNEVRDQDNFTLAYIILLVFTIQPFLRMLSVRPFAFGTLFIVYSVGQKGVLRGVLSSAALSFFYPHLAWFYTIPVGLAHFLKGDKRFALGTISLSLLFLCFLPPSFWEFLLTLFKSGLVRDSINLKIKELFSGFNVLFFIYVSGFLILYPSLSKKTKKLNFENLLIILYLVPSLKHIRYFIDIILPLLFVYFGRELLTVLVEPYQKFTSYLKLSFVFWKSTLKSSLQKLNLLRTRTERKQKHLNLKPYIVILYVLASVLVIQKNHKTFSSFKEFQADLSVIPAGSTVLTYFNLQYKILYLRPDLRIIPSCEIGFPKESIREEYLDFLNEGEILPLARKTNARFLLEPKNMYINPKDGEFLRLVKKKHNLRIWEITGSSEANTTARVNGPENFIRIG